MSTRSGERGLDRLITFLDAIVAIAITLLVLPLVELTNELTAGEDLGELLREHAFSFVAFVLSFYVIAKFWRGHHVVAQDMVAYDTRFVTLSLFWVLTIVFLPFPTALLGPFGDELPVKLLYIGTILLNSLTLLLITWHVDRTPELLPPDVAPRTWHGSAATVLLLLVALALALLVPGVNYWAMLLLLLSGRLSALLRRVRL